MVWVVPIARATFDRCGVVLGGSATLPEAPGRGAYRALGLRGVLMVRGVVLSGRWFTAQFSGPCHQPQSRARF
jgi:hypothetical protein